MPRALRERAARGDLRILDGSDNGAGFTPGQPAAGLAGVWAAVSSQHAVSSRHAKRKKKSTPPTLGKAASSSSSATNEDSGASSTSAQAQAAPAVHGTL